MPMTELLAATEEVLCKELNKLTRASWNRYVEGAAEAIEASTQVHERLHAQGTYPDLSTEDETHAHD